MLDVELAFLNNREKNKRRDRKECTKRTRDSECDIQMACKQIMTVIQMKKHFFVFVRLSCVLNGKASKRLAKNWQTRGRCLVWKINMNTDSGNQRHILRDRRPSTIACPACWAWGQRNLNSLRRGKHSWFCAD